MSSALKFISMSQLLETNCCFPPGSIYFFSDIPLICTCLTKVSNCTPGCFCFGSSSISDWFFPNASGNFKSLWQIHEKDLPVFLCTCPSYIPHVPKSFKTVRHAKHCSTRNNPEWMALCHAILMLAQCINMQIQNSAYANVYEKTCHFRIST